MSMGRIDYQIEKYHFSCSDESPRLTRQWVDVLEECRQQKAGAEERLRIALLNVDYVTSFELPFRLLLLRTPQLIAGLRDELQLNQKDAIFNGKRFGCVWSLKADLSAIPDEFHYHLVTRIRRVSPDGVSSSPFQQIAKEVKSPRERIRRALASGLAVTALDALFWFGCQRMAADVLRLRKTGMRIVTSDADIFDSLTGTIRRVPVYRCDGV
ncbi:DNA-binding protein [Lelliottia aquatilis]|uniref:DNA-binding protein n=2 Tax=Enterobacteriaceae TaxID=543 RepID=A0ABX5A5M8_9ENTR|nr:MULTISPECIES: helix-turn-helix domain-containing protein [Lelliottia]POZ25982.1 DNA-binding protein [Lelliottia aquatilis]POZ29138.1 DNA-binding protein [Lelliottia sp. 7254-16]POZ29536.1 DNA-binding protein [Lelliottia aquatilis]POZ33443.1 DNA-binding protein [Lelliottia aquatilis]POZ39765.1 DNA-binding protein [Lelliottia aquatilis]